MHLNELFFLHMFCMCLFGWCFFVFLPSVVCHLKPSSCLVAFRNKVHGKGVDLIWIKYEIFIVGAHFPFRLEELCICFFRFASVHLVGVFFFSSTLCLLFFKLGRIGRSAGCAGCCRHLYTNEYLMLLLLFYGGLFPFLAKGFMHFTFGRITIRLETDATCAHTRPFLSFKNE